MPLTDRQLDELTEPLEVLFERFYQSVIEDMARRLARIDMSSTTAYQTARLREAGLLYDQLLERLSKLTGLTERELRRAFRKYGAKFTERDEKIYRKAGLVPAPLGQSPAMMNALAAGLRKTGMVAKNLTMTTALTTQQAFIDAADLAYMQVSTGAMNYQSAIREAVLSCAQRGLTVINFASGRQDQLDVAMRRTVLTGVSQTTGVMQMELAREMGCDLVEVDAHFGARNHGTGPMNHESWQGKIYSISGTDRRYPPLIETTGYGTIVGLYGVNCRHSCYPYIEGVSEPSYSNGELREMKERRVRYNGEELTYYDATQKQRAIERAIRKSKREAGALEAAGLDNTAKRVRLGLHQAKMRDFIEQTGLVRDRFREQVPGVNVRAITGKTINALPVNPIRGQRKTPSIGSQPQKILNPSIDNIETYVDYTGNRHEVTAALTEINKVHRSLCHYKVPVIDDPGLPALGSMKSINKEPISIMLNPTGKRPMMTTIHETGHFIDIAGIDKIGEMAEDKTNGVLSDWWLAITKSNAYNELVRVKNAGGVINSQWAVKPDHVAYCLEPCELWARSYAQYIATKSSNQILKNELSVALSEQLARQWQPDDFLEIEKAFDKLFKSWGWLNGH